ncbi:hypothetical protein FBZ85_12620 [Azospirillum brasilense]|nr:hypothetical protein [Azospirillum baldaniorum]TWA69806.1 hypothetical protein FBZ85_12620 [Azospirillum brasilense]
MMDEHPSMSQDEFFEFDPHRVEAAMLFPNDLGKQREVWISRKRSVIASEVLKRDSWPVTLGQADFTILSEGAPWDSLAGLVEKRRVLGWMVAMAFHYFLRTTVWKRGNTLREDKGALATKNKFLMHIETLAKGKVVPGTNKPCPMSEQKYDEARKQLWNAAHLWTAAFAIQGNLPFPELPRERAVQMMELAEGYRLIGIEIGVFQHLAPEKAFSPDAIVFDERFKPQLAMCLDTLGKDELSHLAGYVSRQTISKSKRSKAPR